MKKPSVFCFSVALLTLLAVNFQVRSEGKLAWKHCNTLEKVEGKHCNTFSARFFKKGNDKVHRMHVYGLDGKRLRRMYKFATLDKSKEDKLVKITGEASSHHYNHENYLKNKGQFHKMNFNDNTYKIIRIDKARHKHHGRYHNFYFIYVTKNKDKILCYYSGSHKGLIKHLSELGQKKGHIQYKVNNLVA